MKRLLLAVSFGIFTCSLVGCGGKPEKSAVPENPLPLPDKGARQPMGGRSGEQAPTPKQPTGPRVQKLPLEGEKK